MNGRLWSGSRARWRTHPRDALLDSIHGAGAFRRFKDTLYRLGIEEDWYKYRDHALEEMAIEWLEAEGIPFTRDTED